LFDIDVTARPGVAPEAIEKVLLAELDKLQNTPVSAHDLQKAKNQTRADFVFGQESVQTQAARIGFFQTILGDWRALDAYLPKINAVKAEDVQRVAKLYFRADNRTVGSFVPNGEKPSPESDSGTGHSIRYRQSNRPAAHPGNPAPGRQGAGNPKPLSGAASTSGGKTPVTHERKLPNGMTVIVRENHAVPTVTIRGYVRSGSVNDPAGKFGVSALTADMLTRGTEKKTSQQIAEETDFVGASIGAETGREITNLVGTMLADDFPSMLALLAETVRHPSFPADEIEKAKGESLSALAEEENDTASVATRRLYATLYSPDNPYQHDPLGRLEDVKSLTREDIDGFYHRAYRPERTTLIIVGDVKAEAAFTAVEQAFGDWKGEGEAFPEYNPPALSPAATAPPPQVLTMPDKSQDDIAMGLVALARKNPDYVAAYIMNLILGQDTFVGRIGKRVRDKEGIAYSAYTTFTPGLENGPWVFHAGVNPMNVPKAIRDVRDEVRTMVAGGVTDDELAWAKDNAIGSLQMGLATNGGVAAMLESASVYRLGLDYAERYPQMVRTLTKAQVNATAHKYLKPDALVVVVAGPPVPGLSPNPGSKKSDKEK